MNAITQHVIYDHPKDHPGHWVIRSWDILPGKMRPANEAALFIDLAKARAWIFQEYPWVVRIQTAGMDPDPVVFEVYM